MPLWLPAPKHADALPETKVVQIGGFRVGLCHGHQVTPAGEVEALATLHRSLDVDVLITGEQHPALTTCLAGTASRAQRWMISLGLLIAPSVCMFHLWSCLLQGTRTGPLLLSMTASAMQILAPSLARSRRWQERLQQLLSVAPLQQPRLSALLLWAVQLLHRKARQLLLLLLLPQAKLCPASPLRGPSRPASCS